MSSLIDAVVADTLDERVEFPLSVATTDTVRSISGTQNNVVVSWLEPLTFATGDTAPYFGANADYSAYFGEGWNDGETDAAGSDVARTPVYEGSDSAGWMWINHEYISNGRPFLTSQPSGQHETLALWLMDNGFISKMDLDTPWSVPELDEYNLWWLKNMGGSWFRVIKDPGTGQWSVDRSADNKRFDGTSDTLAKLVGANLTRPALQADGSAYPQNVIPGILADCSGGQSPWGTIFTAEENAQGYYGDPEDAYPNDRFFDATASDGTWGPGNTISPVVDAATGSAFGPQDGTVSLDRTIHRDRDNYSWLVEIDVFTDADDYYGSTTAGEGHLKLGGLGRARWENATFAVDEDFGLEDGKPVVIYAGNDRRNGRVWKFVSSANYTTGMTRAQVRALLEEGTLYVAHFADLDNGEAAAGAVGGQTINGGQAPTLENRGNGRWIEVSLTSSDIAPNAAALGDATKTVGAALQDLDWNGIGGFDSDDAVLRALFTAAHKIGVRETNRPEDLEYNPCGYAGGCDDGADPVIYIAFTNHNRDTALDDDGVLRTAVGPRRSDRLGSVMALVEDDAANPGSSEAFTFYWAWRGTSGQGLFDAANPDNIMIGPNGEVWFGTDGNFGTNGHADSAYYLDLDPAHRDGEAGVVNPTFGLPFRVAAGPSDSEATGPVLSAGGGTLFFNVQHPGEGRFSAWPTGGRPLSALVAITMR